MVEHLSQCDKFAWDHETRSEDFEKYPDGALRTMTMRSDLVSFATPDMVSYVVPLGMVTIPCLPERDFFDAIRPVMENNRIKHLGWNSCFDQHAMANYDVWVANVIDVMVMGYILDTVRSNSLKDRCSDAGMQLSKYDFKTYWKARHSHITGEKAKRAKSLTFEDLKQLEKEYVSYSAEDAEATMLLYNLYEEELAKQPIRHRLFYKLRNPAAVRTIFNMERRGMRVDVDFLTKQADAVKSAMEEAEAKVYEEAGSHFNIGSTKVLGDILYNQLGLPVLKITERGANSTDADALAGLAQRGYKIAQRIVEHRRLSKLYGTYLSPESKLAKQVYEWGHIHGSFNATGTRTGRLSSSSPNMQNFPKSTEKNYHFRKAFVPSAPRYKIIGGDYAQIELRVVAHLSQDHEMCLEYLKDARLWELTNQGVTLQQAVEIVGAQSDLHQATANACGSSRNSAKAINFGIIYCMYSKSLAYTLTRASWDAMVDNGEAESWDDSIHNVPEWLAKEYIEGYFRKYRGIAAYQEAIGRKVDLQGYIETRYGFRRHLPDAFSSDPYLRSAARRQGVNTTVQGHVGELMLHCMSRAEKNRSLRRMGFRLLSQVHDEVIGEAPEETAEDCRNILVSIFQNPAPCTEAYPFAGYRVPLLFDARIADSWHDAH